MFSETPLLLCVDLQNEFLVEGRPHSIADARRTISCCLDIQATWRRHMWPIAHLKRIAKAAYFNPASTLTEWIDDVRPLPAEISFEHPLPSAYSSAKFSEYMTNIGNLRCVVVGFALNDSIISTVIEGFHRGDRFEVLREAVGCRESREQPLRSPIFEVLESFCKVIDRTGMEELCS